jgi:hypothetical protein
MTDKQRAEQILSATEAKVLREMLTRTEAKLRLIRQKLEFLEMFEKPKPSA